MNNDYVNDIRKKVKRMLGKDNKDRYYHTIGVANTCACLAMRYSADIEKSYIAGLLHDCAKCLSDNELLTECSINNIDVTPAEEAAPYLLHGKVGAFYAKRDFDITDQEILSAIECHTTGKASMSLIEEILFIADYIEPRRNKASDLDEIRLLAFTDIKRCIYRVCEDTIDYIKAKKLPIDQTTYETYKAYEKYK